MHSKRTMKYILLYSFLIFSSIKTAYCQNNTAAKQGEDGVSGKKLFNTGFENKEGNDWEVLTILEGKGSKELSSDIKRNGGHSLKLTKTNSFGYVIASAKQPVTVKAGQSYTFRFWFNTHNAQITSFLIPRLITDTTSTVVANPYSPLWIGQDWESQSLLRNSPSTEKKDWIKRVVFYENKTDKVQQLYLQVALYGNPFTVYIDDLEFEEGQVTYTREPEIPGYAFTEAEVEKIVSERKEETASLHGTDGTTYFTLNGKESWPVIYRAWYSGGGSTDPGGFGKQGININNVELVLLRDGYKG
jgi:hypothetical protein